MPLRRLARLCGTFTGTLTRAFLCRFSRDRITALRKVGGGPFTLSTPAWTTTRGSGLHRTGVGEVGVLAMAGMEEPTQALNR